MEKLDKDTLLIVDDEPLFREALAFDFIRKGYNVFHAQNGIQAFEIIKREKIDLVLTDIRMQGGDGIELLNQIKFLNSVFPIVIFITGYTDISLEEAYDKGVEAVFSKPFERKVLFETVARVIKERRERHVGRQGPRSISDLLVILSFADTQGMVHGRVLNIGRGGLFVAYDGNLPPLNARVRFQIQLETRNPILIAGEGIVRWVRQRLEDKLPPGLGLEFTYLDPYSRSQVLNLMNELKTKSLITRI